MRSAKLPLALVLVLVSAVAALLLWFRIGATPPDSSRASDAADLGLPMPAAATAEPGDVAERERIAAVDPTNLPPTDTEDGFTIHGTVLADPRRPIAGATIRAFAGQPTDQPGFAAMMGQRTSRSRDGIPWLPTGEPIAIAAIDAAGMFTLRCRERHLRLSLAHDFFALPMPEIVHVSAATRTAQVVLTPYLGGCVRGRLTGVEHASVHEVRLAADADPSAAVRDPSAFLGTMMAAMRPPVTPTADGGFVFTAVLADAPFVLSARGTTACGRSPQPPLQPGELRELLLPLTAAGAIDVTVVDETGAAIADASVRATPVAETRGIGMASRQTGVHQQTREDGTCHLPGLTPGRWRVEALPPRRLAAETALEVPPGTAAAVRLTCGSGSRVAGIVVTPEGKPVAEARVAHNPGIEIPLFGDMTSQLGYDVLAQIAADGAPTDADGRFELTGIADDGTFTLFAAHPDWAGGLQKGVRAGDRDVRITMAGKTGLRGQVIAAVDGKPVQSFTLRVQAAMFAMLQRTIATQVVDARADGAFALDGLPPGACTLVIEADGHARHEHELTLVAGQTTDVGELALPRGVTLTGVVRAADGRGIAAALVRRRLGGMLDNPALSMFSGGGGVTTRTDGEGRFALPDLSPGRIQLHVTAKGFSGTRSERFELAPGEQRTDVVIVLGHGGSIAGRLLVGPGMQTADFLVMAQEQQSQATMSGTIAADGTFTITDLEPGQYNVQAMRMAVFAGLSTEQDWRPGQGVKLGEMIASVSKNIVARRCAVRDGEVTEVELDARELDLGAELLLRVELGGQPLTGGLVELTAVADGRLRTGFLSDGTATFGAMTPGSLRAQVRGGLALQPIGEAQTIEFPVGAAEHRVTLSLPGGELSGRVVDATTGDPLRHALVRLLHRDDRDRDDRLGVALTDADGRFAFPGLADGAYGLLAADAASARGDGTASRLDGLLVRGGIGQADLVLRAERGASVSALVTDEAGRPIAGAMVLCVDEQGHTLGGLPLAVSGPDGRAVFGGMPGGRLRVVGRASGRAPGASELQDLRIGDTVEFVLPLPTGVPVVLHAVDRDHQVLAGAEVSARCNGGAWFPALLLLERRSGDGRLELGRLGPGDWEFAVSHPTVGTFTARRTIGGTASTLVLTPP
ncbi:MAG: carboxypeptidase regulatory-like domain-containing protein [Planctomycetes bacterium]|nr:carboxypeptidase regulatory-like domain-containing protein [Planctomycetota bacterium]